MPPKPTNNDCMFNLHLPRALRDRLEDLAIAESRATGKRVRTNTVILEMLTGKRPPVEEVITE
jgi:hypothetical protein